MNEKLTHPKPKKIIWISFMVFDLFLHKTALLEISRYMSIIGNDFTLIAVRSNKKLDGICPEIDLKLIPLRFVPVITPLLFALIIFFLLPIYMIFERPDYIITEPGPSIVSFLWGAILKNGKTKFILDIRSTPVEVIGYRARMRELWFKISVLISKKMFNGITIVTDFMKKELCSNFHIDEKFVGVWANGVNMKLFDPKKYDGNEFRKKMNLSNKFIIIYHGVLQYTRGLFETVKAVQILKEKYPDLLLFLLGDGPAFQNLKKSTETDKDNIFIHKSVDYNQVPYFIAMSDIGIMPLPDLPDWRYQCALNLLEYLAMKKSVIITDILSNKIVAGNCKCAIYISSAEPKKIAEAIEYAYNNKDNLTRWGMQGQKIIKEKYSWVKMAEKLDKFLQERM
jgi:glycosyltransferase involved in cell wall biosynthesis